jgi:hypothetical protein
LVTVLRLAFDHNSQFSMKQIDNDFKYSFKKLISKLIERKIQLYYYTNLTGFKNLLGLLPEISLNINKIISIK